MSANLSANDGLKIIETGSIPKDAVVINGLPDVGLVGLLAASHIISDLKLREVGAIESDLLPPMIVLHGGEPKAPPHLLGQWTRSCDIRDRDSWFAHPSSRQRPRGLGTAKNARLMLSLGGMAVANRQDIDVPKVFAALSAKGLEPQLHGAAEILEEGYIVGAYGLLLRKCAQTGLPAITLLTQSHYNYPDPEAAGAALTAVNRILDLKVDVSELLNRGEEIRLRSKDMMHRTHEEMNKMNKSHEYDLPPLYG